GRLHTVRLQLWKQSLKRGHKGSLVDRSPHLAAAGLPVTGSHFPKAGIRQGFQHIFETNVRPPVAFPLEREYGIRTSFHTAYRHSREMDTEKRKPRIRHGVDQVLHQEVPRRNQFVVLAAKRNDAHSRINSAHSRNAIGLKSSTIDDSFRPNMPRIGLEDQLAASSAAADDTRFGFQVTTAIQRHSAHCPNYGRVVGDARRRDKKTTNPGSMRLMLANFFRS